MRKKEFANLKKGDIVHHNEWFECKIIKVSGSRITLKPTDELYVKLIKKGVCYNSDGSFDEYDWQNKIKIKNN